MRNIGAGLHRLAPHHTMKHQGDLMQTIQSAPKPLAGQRGQIYLIRSIGDEKDVKSVEIGLIQTVQSTSRLNHALGRGSENANSSCWFSRQIDPSISPRD